MSSINHRSKRQKSRLALKPKESRDFEIWIGLRIQELGKLNQVNGSKEKGIEYVV